MSLADYTPLSQSVSLGRGATVSVRGLSIDDIAVLLKDHLSDLDGLFELWERSSDQPLASARFVVALTREAPALVATLIALAADEPDMVAKARRLSLPVQIELLKAVLRLTFEEAGGAKKFVESLNQLLRGMRPALSKTDSPT